MFVELGHYALVLALALALIQSIIPIWGAATRDGRLMAIAGPVAGVQFLMIGVAFVALTQAYVLSDFSLQNVWANSHSTQPLLYKYTSVWGNHEGSMLLWVLILALFGALVAAFGHNMPKTLKANVLAVQAWVCVAFLAFILFTSNPFERIAQAPIEGRDLNPILQDIGLAIHPPLLYIGYVGFSIAFSFAAAALLEGRIDAAWARWVRPWVLIAWIFLTLGIAMGSYWAYYELGWGGFWFWDPVENASFMPWLAGTALLHSAIVMEKRDALKVWTILLAILTFSLSLLGTFLVRSGVLTSVHSFATDPTRGVFILGILALFIGGAFALFAWRAPMLRQGGLFSPISREGALVFNNLFLTASCAAVLFGTLYPLMLEATTGEKISVGAPFFDMTFGLLILPVLIATPFGPLLAWKRGDIVGATQRLFVAFGLAILSAAITAWLVDGGPLLAVIGVGLAAWIMIGAFAEMASRMKLLRVPFGQSLTRLAGMPRTVIGTALAHFGVGVTVLGIVVTSAWQTEHILVMKAGDTADIGAYEVKLLGSETRDGPNFKEYAAHFELSKGGEMVAKLDPSKRVYTARGMPTTESAIYTIGFSQVYLAIGDQQGGGGLAVRLYWKPFVTLVWLGSLVMAFGGVISMTDRRLRIGAPKRAKKRQTAAAAE
ncbi:MAG: heme lyase NrfEFG subunit NrfE [Hyphomicrobiales bacterium]|nr:MAG: heme lyase NrfEFG subunit NrfE [Hyphomicrobiales bacterium]